MVLLVADPGLAATGLIEDVDGSLEKAGLGVSTVLRFRRRPDHRRGRRRGRLRPGASGPRPWCRSAAARRSTSARPSRRSPRLPRRRAAYELAQGAVLPGQAPRLARHPDHLRHRLGADPHRHPHPRRQGQGLAVGRTMKPDEVILDPETDAVAAARRSPPRPASTRWSTPWRRPPTATPTPANNVYAHEAIRLAARHLRDGGRGRPRPRGARGPAARRGAGRRSPSTIAARRSPIISATRSPRCGRSITAARWRSA